MERFGRFHKTLDSGLHFLIPFVSGLFKGNSSCSGNLPHPCRKAGRSAFLPLQHPINSTPCCTMIHTAWRDHDTCNAASFGLGPCLCCTVSFHSRCAVSPATGGQRCLCSLPQGAGHPHLTPDGHYQGAPAWRAFTVCLHGFCAGMLLLVLGCAPARCGALVRCAYMAGVLTWCAAQWVCAGRRGRSAACCCQLSLPPVASLVVRLPTSPPPACPPACLQLPTSACRPACLHLPAHLPAVSRLLCAFRTT